MMHQSTTRTSPHLVQLSESQIDACFKDQTHQVDVLINLYKLVYGDQWDNIESISRWPSCNDSTWKAIARKFIDFDHAHHTSLAGGLWLQNGWMSAEGLKDWQVDTSSCEIKYKNELADTVLPPVPKEGHAEI